MLYDKIVTIICEQLDLEPSEISRETRFLEDLSCDSLDVVEITMALEEEFGMAEVSEEDMKNMLTVGALADYVAARTGG